MIFLTLFSCVPFSTLFLQNFSTQCSKKIAHWRNHWYGLIEDLNLYLSDGWNLFSILYCSFKNFFLPEISKLFTNSPPISQALNWFLSQLSNRVCVLLLSSFYYFYDFIIILFYFFIFVSFADTFSSVSPRQITRPHFFLSSFRYY